MKNTNMYLVEEVSKYLRFHPHTIRKLAREGKIPAFKIGGQWRFDAQAISTWKQIQLDVELPSRQIDKKDISC